MPMPVVVYLGPGSDKFVGNAERDICFPGGARRNRCVGRGNNDVCITGPRNSDCVGGGGNDFCRHGAGSDGCWGGRGRDMCIMGPGMDGCHGGPGNDRLYGGPQPRPALRRPRLRLLQRPKRLGQVAQLQRRPAALSLSRFRLPA